MIKILDALDVDGDRWTEVVTIAREASEKGWWESDKTTGERRAPGRGPSSWASKC